MCNLPCRWVIEILSIVVCMALFVMCLTFDFTILVSVSVIIIFWRVSNTCDSADER
jgi:uncharacterized membrane protein YoaT (DUF817 family)